MDYLVNILLFLNSAY